MARVQAIIDAGFSVRRAHSVTGSVAASVSAAGTSQSDATELTADNNLITTASEGQGVRLMSFAAGDVIVVNGTRATILVYPVSGGKLNNQPANAALDLPPGAGAIFKAISSTDCLVIC